jgi:hypothetical protein
MHPRATPISCAPSASQHWLLENARSRIGRDVQSAAVIVVDDGPLGAAAWRGERLVIAVTDDEVYLLDYRPRTFTPSLGCVVRQLPRSGVLVRWRRRLVDIKVEFSWPKQHVFLTGTACLDAQTDRVLGQLMSSELEQPQPGV